MMPVAGVPGCEEIAFATRGDLEAIHIAAVPLRTRNLVPTAKWTDLMRNGHDRGFAVAGAMKLDMLAEFAGAIETVAKEGKSIEWFRQNFDQIVERHGWDYNGPRNWRTRTIYTTNMSTSYAAGRRAQQRDPDLLKVAPYLMYRHGGSAEPRPHHLDWDRLVVAANDPWVKKHYPPNEWGCSCYMVAVSKAQAERMGGRFEAPPANDPDGAIGEGWDYTPGDTVADEIRQIVDEKIIRAPATLGSQFAAATPAVVATQRATAFAEMVDAVAAQLAAGKARPTGKQMVVGTIESKVITELERRKIAPKSAALLVRDQDVLHTHRDKKTSKVPMDWYRNLPRHLPNRQAVLLDTTQARPSLLYVFPDPDDPDGKLKLVVQLDYQVAERDASGKKVTALANVLRSGRRVSVPDLRAAGIEVLDGRL